MATATKATTPVLDMELQPKAEPSALPVTTDRYFDLIDRACTDPAFDVTKL